MDQLSHAGLLDQPQKMGCGAVPAQFFPHGGFDKPALVGQAVLPFFNLQPGLEFPIFLPPITAIGEPVIVKPVPGQRLAKNMHKNAYGGHGQHKVPDLSFQQASHPFSHQARLPASGSKP